MSVVNLMHSAFETVYFLIALAIPTPSVVFVELKYRTPLSERISLTFSSNSNVPVFWSTEFVETEYSFLQSLIFE